MQNVPLKKDIVFAFSLDMLQLGIGAISLFHQLSSCLPFHSCQYLGVLEEISFLYLKVHTIKTGFAPLSSGSNM